MTKSARQGLKAQRRDRRAMDSISSSLGMGGRTGSPGEGAFGARRGGGFSMFGAKAPPPPEGSINYAKQEHVGGDCFRYVESRVDQRTRGSRTEAVPAVVNVGAGADRVAAGGRGRRAGRSLVTAHRPIAATRSERIASSRPAAAIRVACTSPSDTEVTTSR